MYGNSAHRVWLVDQWNLVVDTYLVSGRASTPAAGTYSVYSKSEQAWAGHDGITMRWMVRFAHGKDLGSHTGWALLPYPIRRPCPLVAGAFGHGAGASGGAVPVRETCSGLSEKLTTSAVRG